MPRKPKCSGDVEKFLNSIGEPLASIYREGLEADQLSTRIRTAELVMDRLHGRPPVRETTVTEERIAEATTLTGEELQRALEEQHPEWAALLRTD